MEQKARKPKKAPLVHLVSLGCPKNRVDAEVMLGGLLGKGAELTEDPKRADLILVNTCAFITPAIEESIETILELAKAKRRKGAKLVVTGCLVERYKSELVEQLPEVDHFFGTGAVLDVAKLLDAESPERLVRRSPGYLAHHDDGRVLSGSPASAYIKISEGCDCACAFCVIPRLRGRAKSRSVADIAAEARALLARGVVELNIVGQDVTAYGADLKDGSSLLDLLRTPELVEGAHWLRLHYFYPARVTDELITAMRQGSAVVPYIDMPIQHIDDAILRRMNRKDTELTTRQAIERIHRLWPQAVLRTSVIVGFPGEDEASFERLLTLVTEGHFERLGAFAFSAQDGTRAARLGGQVPEELIAERLGRLMEAQRAVSREKLKALVGRTVEVLVEGPSAESELLLAGRYFGQAPEIDGTTFITAGKAQIGRIQPLKIAQAHDYDLAGRIPARRPASDTRFLLS